MGNELQGVASEPPAMNYTGIDQEYAKLYFEHDSDKDGFITEAEFFSLLGRLGILHLSDPERLEKFFADANLVVRRSEKLDLSEFLALMHSHKPMNDIEQAFAMLDLNGDSFITVAEIHDGLERLGQHLNADQAAGFLRNFDANRDQRISFEEFARILNTNNIVLRRLLRARRASSNREPLERTYTM